MAPSINRYKIIFVLFLVGGNWAFGCDGPNAKVQVNRRGSGETLTKVGSDALELSWDPSASKVTSYHVFYTGNVLQNSGGKEIDSFTDKSPNFSKPSIILDRTNIDPFPSPGTTVCFYVQAKNDTMRSDPSDPVCAKL